MERVWTALLALAYPTIYVLPASVIRLVLAGEDENITAQQIARIVYVAGLVLASDGGGRTSGPAGWDFLNHVYSFPGGIADVLLFGVAPILCLFAGSMYGKQLPMKRRKAEVLRDLVASPVLEELVFRALLLKWLVLSRGVESIPKVVFLSPAIFALAHAHHPFINVRRGVRRSVACQWFLLQTSFTYFFGVFASIMFIKTGSVWVAVAAHAVANLFGFPRLGLRDPGVMAVHVLGLTSFLTFTWMVYQQIVVI